MSCLRGQESRLRDVFERVLRLSRALPLVLSACSTGSSTAPHDAGAETAPVDTCAPAIERVVFAQLDGGVAECRAFQRLSCGLPPNIEPTEGGCTFALRDCLKMCPSYGAYDCHTTDASCAGGKVVRPGPVTVMCDFCPGGLGRRPSGLVAAPSARSASVLGDYFASAAHLEAASVHAFSELGRTLTALDAPTELVEAARDALRDEVRHARTTARFARRHGGRPRAVRVRRQTRAPTLDTLALENAAEGCVRETYAALIAAWQAERARDPEVAETMRAISRDETRHAALAWTVAVWAHAKLDGDARGHVSDAVERAVRALYDEIVEPPDELVSVAGLPSSTDQYALVDGLRRTLWRDPFQRRSA